MVIVKSSITSSINPGPTIRILSWKLTLFNKDKTGDLISTFNRLPHTRASKTISRPLKAIKEAAG
jgi:hypothetical protein